MSMEKRTLQNNLKSGSFQHKGKHQSNSNPKKNLKLIENNQSKKR